MLRECPFVKYLQPTSTAHYIKLLATTTSRNITSLRVATSMYLISVLTMYCILYILICHYYHTWIEIILIFNILFFQTGKNIEYIIPILGA